MIKVLIVAAMVAAYLWYLTIGGQSELQKQKRIKEAWVQSQKKGFKKGYKIGRKIQKKVEEIAQKTRG